VCESSSPSIGSAIPWKGIDNKRGRLRVLERALTTSEGGCVYWKGH
jgi:hypothetical protein